MRYQRRMQAPDIPLTRDLVLIGGGHTHALVLRMWGMRPIPGVRLTVVNPFPSAAYSGMLPGFVAGHYSRDDLGIDLVRLARFAGARLLLTRATGIDRAERRVLLEGRPPAAYDILSIDIGITSEMPSVPGFAEHAIPAKPLDAFARRWAAFAAGPSPGAVAVIGAGAAGCELALAVRHRLGTSVPVTLIDAATPLSDLSAPARRRVLAALRRAKVTLVADAPVTAVEPDAVILGNGRRIASAFTIGAAATRPHPWLAGTGLGLTDGYITVDETLRSPDDPQVFACGDTAHLSHDPRPKAGVYAVRQAPVLLANLSAALTGRGRMRAYRPQKDYLKLLSLGAKEAVADKWGLALEGAAIWRWKDRIDRRFMEKFGRLPAMPAPALPATLAAGVREEIGSGKPLCAGCGAKVGGAALRATLADLPPPLHPDVIAGAGDDAAILRHGAGRQVITTDHLRAFTEDPFLMTRIAAVHALGDVWAMGASPQAALAQVVLPRMNAVLQERTLAEIMAAAVQVFRDEGADIVGGHTSTGAELTIGFTVTGLAEAGPIGQSGARPGDALILTKPLGTGVILAAEMARAAAGRDVQAAWDSMSRAQGDAARLLAPSARAMTDVTGFGLAGHLVGMLEASGVAARLDLAALPLLPGAEALSAGGHASTLAPANRSVTDRMEFAESPRAALLFDPQTGGGLLAAVPADKAGAVLAGLHAAGFPEAAQIGTVTEGPARIVVRT